MQLTLNTPKHQWFERLGARLKSYNRSFPEFFDGVIAHGDDIALTSDQWLEFLLKVPHWRLLREKALLNKLSPNQREILEKELKKPL